MSNRIPCLQNCIPCFQILCRSLFSNSEFRCTKRAAQLVATGCSFLVSGGRSSEIQSECFQMILRHTFAIGINCRKIALGENIALQCGICTPGLLVASKALLEENPDPTEEEIRYWLAGNLCRCTGYHKVIEAVQDAAREMRGA